MHFLINGSKAGRSRKRRRVTVAGRRRTKSGRFTSNKGTAMATKRRRRRKVATNTPKRRRRRRVRSNPGALAAARRVNPRRRRRSVARANPSKRRRFRRNPSLASARGLVGGIVQGLKDGGAVFVGQVATRKVRGAIFGMMPTTLQTQVSAPGVASIGLKLASAVAVSLIARKAAPSQARMITAGAFSEVINTALASTPIYPYLSAYPGTTTRRALPAAASGRAIAARSGTAAWPGARAGVGAMPTMRSVGMPVAAGVL